MKNLLPTLLLCVAATAAPGKPSSDETVLEQLPSNPFSKTDRRVAQTSAAACKLARSYIALGREQGDPRYVSRAEALIQPFIDSNNNAEALLVAAIIRQYSHDFSGSLNLLDRALAADPSLAEAWLIRCTILQVTGRYDEARTACIRLAGKTDQIVLAASAASIASFTGPLEGPLQTLNSILERNAAADSSTRAWALSILAEIATAAGDEKTTERSLIEARLLQPHDSFLSGAWADFLIDQGRRDEVVALLRNETRNDALLLRYAVALGSGPEFKAACETLASRFAALELRHDSVHQREHARFCLLIGETKTALKLASENWGIQKERPDARILLECALAGKNAAAAQPVIDWMQTNHLVDQRLSLLIAQLKGI